MPISFAPGFASRASQAMMWLLIALAFGNALLFAHVAANPMITADNWTFVGTFLSEAVEHRLGIGDFLVKRAGLDHGQPLIKLMMLLNYRAVGLDFSVEAMLGVVFAALGFIVIYRMSVSDADRGARSLVFRTAIVAIAAVYVSLNVHHIFTYSLLTLGYLNFLLMLLAAYAAWRAVKGAAVWPFALAMLVYAIGADTEAILTGASLTVALLWAGWKLRSIRRALLLIAIILAALVVSHVVYQQFGEIRGTTQAVFNVPMREHIAGLLGQWRDAWRWVVVPLASGLAHAEQLQHFVGARWQATQIAIGGVLLALHLWFWIAAFRSPARAARFLAICVMMIFYTYLAGVLYGRVFVRGSVFLDQHRYVHFYQLHLVALLLMAVARELETSPPPIAARRAVAVLAGILILAQVPMSTLTWSAVDWINGYYRNVAEHYGRVARNPVTPSSCALVDICTMPAEERVRTMTMLRRHRVNLFSPYFAKAHPELVEAAGLAPAPD